MPVALAWTPAAKRIATNIRSEPAIVKRKNFIVGVDAPLPAPDADDEVHRDEHHFPEDVEEDRVEGDEAPEHPRLEDEERHDVALRSSWMLLAAREEEDADGQERRQEDEGDRRARPRRAR